MERITLVTLGKKQTKSAKLQNVGTILVLKGLSGNLNGVKFLTQISLSSGQAKLHFLARGFLHNCFFSLALTLIYEALQLAAASPSNSGSDLRLGKPLWPFKLPLFLVFYFAVYNFYCS